MSRPSPSELANQAVDLVNRLDIEHGVDRYFFVILVGALVKMYMHRYGSKSGRLLLRSIYRLFYNYQANEEATR